MVDVCMVLCSLGFFSGFKICILLFTTTHMFGSIRIPHFLFTHVSFSVYARVYVDVRVWVCPSVSKPRGISSSAIIFFCSSFFDQMCEKFRFVSLFFSNEKLRCPKMFSIIHDYLHSRRYLPNGFNVKIFLRSSTAKFLVHLVKRLFSALHI